MCAFVIYSRFLFGEFSCFLLLNIIRIIPLCYLPIHCLLLQACIYFNISKIKMVINLQEEKHEAQEEKPLMKTEKENIGEHLKAMAMVTDGYIQPHTAAYHRHSN